MPGAGSDRRRWVSCAGGAFVGWVRGLSGDGREGFTRGRGRRSGGRAPVIRKRRGQIRLLLILTRTRGAGGSAPGIGSRDAPRPIERRHFARILRGRSRGGAHLDDAARKRAGGGSHLCLFSTVRRPFVLSFSGGPCVVCRLPRTRRGTRTRARGLKNLCAGRSRECSLAKVPPVARSVRPATVRITLVPLAGPLEPPRFFC